MNPSITRCPACRIALPDEPAQMAALRSCPGCSRPIEILPFPGLNRPTVVGRPAEAVTGEGEAACFFHSTKKAVVPCDSCGRFLCALCDIELEGQHLCPACLQAGQASGELPGLERPRTRWDQLVWWLNLGLLTCVGAPLIALINIVITIVCWNKPGSRVHRHRLSLLLGTLVSVTFTLTLIGIAVFAASKD
jgi:hypothetical protein